MHSNQSPTTVNTEVLKAPSLTQTKFATLTLGDVTRWSASARCLPVGQQGQTEDARTKDVAYSNTYVQLEMKT